MFDGEELREGLDMVWEREGVMEVEGELDPDGLADTLGMLVRVTVGTGEGEAPRGVSVLGGVRVAQVVKEPVL